MHKILNELKGQPVRIDIRSGSSAGVIVEVDVGEGIVVLRPFGRQDTFTKGFIKIKAIDAVTHLTAAASD